MPSEDTNVGAKRARLTREGLDLDSAAPLDCVLTLIDAALGLPVVIAALPAGIAGCCWRDGERVVLRVNGTHAPVCQRFTLAHELGHVRCGHDGATPVETFTTLGGKSTDSREVQANAFAAEFLAPAERLRAEGPNHVWALDFQFDQTADGKVLKLLNVVDEHTRQAHEMRLPEVAFERDAHILGIAYVLLR